jgi:DNA-binding CsgD family transcriptional regulator/PAS domain-containing protein
MLSPELERALSLCYDCMLDQSAWPSAMHALAQAAGADAACLYAERTPQLRLRLPASPAYQGFLEDFMRGGWWASDHRALRGWPRLRGGGRILVERDLVTDAERLAMPVYHELYARHDLTWWAAVSFRVGEQDWAMPLLRGEKSGPFDNVEALLPAITHLARIVGLARDLLASHARNAVELFEAGHKAAVVIDPFGRCLAINPAAEAMLGRDLMIVRGRLTATDANSERQLQGLIAGALQARSLAELPPPVVIRRESKRPLIIDAVATPSSLGKLDLGLQAVLLLTDLQPFEAGHADRLRRVFGLTAAEARLANQLAGGVTLAEASEQLSLSKETARTQLKAIFNKTRTNRQTDLVRLLERASGGH